MTEQAASELFHKIAKELNLPTSWHLHFDCARRRFGQCRYRTSTISLSRPLVLLNDASKVESTIRHEIAHALVGPGHGHDSVWRNMAIRCGDSGQRCYGYDVVTPEARYVAGCWKCGKVYKALRLRKRMSSCSRCGKGRFDTRFLLRFETNTASVSSELIMMNQTTLKAGLVVRYNDALYRVDHCNQSRARIVPITRRQIENDNFDGDDRGGVNISAHACVDIVDDVVKAADELDLAREEAELRKLQAELAAEQRKAATTLPTVKTSTIVPKVATIRAAKGQGWVRSAKAVPGFRAGSLAETVLAFICANPGMSTAQIVSGVKADGNVASCVSRFMQGGLIEKA